jgi:undecaprenyl diphosphate synthase
MSAAEEPASAIEQGSEPSPQEQAASSARYVAIITDGNGRWARAHGRPVNEGHSAGADTVKARLRDATELGVEELTVYSFSTENWCRPQEEVDGLIEMMASRIARETPELDEEGVRMRFIGRREGIPAYLLEQMDKAQALTDSNRRITLCIAFNYGGRAEILDAARRFTGDTEEEFSRLLYAPDMHDPELLIRTGSERRLSNFVLWQAAYSEFVFRDELWPDFSREALQECLREFSERRRHFGGRTEMAAQPHQA